MRRLVIPLLIALLCLCWGAVSQAEIEQGGGLRVTFDADFAPRSLPRDRPAPVKIEVHGAIATTGTILAFNSRRRGRLAMVLHLFAAVPVRFTLVVPLAIGQREEGQFGTVLRAKIPKLGGGLGSITEVDLKIGRQYSFGGKRRSYVSAACGAPAGLSAAVFPFARGSFRFEARRQI